jgi:peptidoglycan/xylan/chitin deacetylase (PgdA/CDA1 family)
VNAKRLIKRLWGFLYFYCGIFHLIRFRNNIVGKRLTIVTYHRITGKNVSQIELSLPYLFTSLKNFERQLRFLKKWYTVIGFDGLREHLKNNDIPWDALIITFDDGYADNYYNAYHLLIEMNLPATFFVPAEKIDSVDSQSFFWWDKAYHYFNELLKLNDERVLQKLDHKVLPLLEEFKKNPADLFSRLNKEESVKIEKMVSVLEIALGKSNDGFAQANSTMTWEEISEMGKKMHFGSHTCSHDNILTMEQTRRMHEIKESKKIIEEKTKQNVNVFSYPCGNVDEEVRTLVKDAGYEFAVTTEKGVNDLTDRFALKRINVWEDTGLSLGGEFSKGYFAFKLSGM